MPSREDVLSSALIPIRVLCFRTTNNTSRPITRLLEEHDERPCPRESAPPAFRNAAWPRAVARSAVEPGHRLHGAGARCTRIARAAACACVYDAVPRRARDGQFARIAERSRQI